MEGRSLISRGGTVATLLLLSACASSPSGATPSPSPSPSLTSSAPPLAGGALAIKGTASLTFQAGSFSRDYQLVTDPNQPSAVNLGSHQAYLNLWVPGKQDFHVYVIDGAAPGAHLSGPNQVLASFSDTDAHIGGIATVGQGICTLDLTKFGAGGMTGSFDCENVAGSMASTTPVSFRGSIDTVPA